MESGAGKNDLMKPTIRAALAGAGAAATWAAAEPLLRRVCRTPYSDVRLLGRLVARGRRVDTAGLALHVANGALAGIALDRLRMTTIPRAVLAAELETFVLWPGMVLVERIHPIFAEEVWPRPIAKHGPTILEQVLAHALFGAVYGGLARRR